MNEEDLYIQVCNRQKIQFQFKAKRCSAPFPYFRGDHRHSNATRHDLYEMLMIALMTVLAVGETCTDMDQFGREKKAVLRRFMTLKHGIPSHDAFSDLFNCPDSGELGRTLASPSMRWVKAMKTYLGDDSEDVIVIDGKALRRSSVDAPNRQPLHLVHAFVAGSK